MHYIVLDRLSRQTSYLHRVDARIKLLTLLVFLITLATTSPLSPATATAFLSVLVVGLILSRLPAGWILSRAAAVLPFTVVFALVAWWTSGPEPALTLLAKSYLSALAVLSIVSTTPMPALMDAATRLGSPRLVVTVMQFLYRYLFLVSDEARRMWAAAQLRGASLQRTSYRDRMTAAAGTLAVLFARSMFKAERIHMAMLSRGFTGAMPPLTPVRVKLADIIFLALAAALLVSIRFVSPGFLSILQ